MDGGEAEGGISKTSSTFSTSSDAWDPDPSNHRRESSDAGQSTRVRKAEKDFAASVSLASSQSSLENFSTPEDHCPGLVAHQLKIAAGKSQCRVAIPLRLRLGGYMSSTRPASPSPSSRRQQPALEIFTSFHLFSDLVTSQDGSPYHGRGSANAKMRLQLAGLLLCHGRWVCRHHDRLRQCLHRWHSCPAFVRR